MKTIKYGLRIKNTDELLKYKKISIKGNEEQLEVYQLCENGNENWLVENPEIANEALNETTLWFQSNYHSPLIAFDRSELEVVQLTEIVRMESYKGQSIYEDLDMYHRNKVEEALRMMLTREEKNEPAFEIQNTPVVSVATMEKTEVMEETKKTIKIKVKCTRDIPKELGSVRMKNEPALNCFHHGKHYLAYVKNDKLYIINEDKVPEFICNASDDKKWQENVFFATHFEVEEYLD